jgi:hypothetical protein
MNKVPVITSNHGLIYWYNKKYKIGKSTDLRSPNKVRKVINFFINNNEINFTDKFKKTNNIHNSDNFSEQIENCLITNKNKCE